MTIILLITYIQMCGLIQPLVWKCPIPSQFYEGCGIHVSSDMVKGAGNKSIGTVSPVKGLIFKCPVVELCKKS